MSLHLAEATGANLIAELHQGKALDDKRASLVIWSLHEQDGFPSFPLVDFQIIGFRDGIKILEDLRKCREESELFRIESQSLVHVFLLLPNR